MSKSRAKKYYVEDDYDQEDSKSKRKRFEDRRNTKRMKQAIKAQNLEYIENDGDTLAQREYD